MNKNILFVMIILSGGKAFANESVRNGRCEDAVFLSSPSGSFSSEMQSAVHFTCNNIHINDVPGRYPNVAITLSGVGGDIPTVWVYDWHARNEDWALKYNRANHIKETKNTFSIEYSSTAVIDHINGRSIPVKANGSSIFTFNEVERVVTITVSVVYLGLDREYHYLYYRFLSNNYSKEKMDEIMKKVREVQ